MKTRCTGAFVLLVMMLVLATSAFATDYYVATNGDDNDPGTLAEPFATIQKASDSMSAGDTCYIRTGAYHETVTISTNSGTAANPITFTNYNDEAVTLDGTIPITSGWTQYSGNIYETTLSQDIWQLFDDGEMMIPARWPNAFLHDGSIWDRDSTWGQGDESSDSNGVMYDDPVVNDLSASGLSLAGAVGILNVGSFRTSTRVINSHTAGSDTFTYDSVTFTYKTNDHYYYAEAKLNLLDASREWYYDSSTKKLYLWAPGGGVPSGDIRGKNQAYAFDVTASNYVVLDGLNFFGTAFKFYGSENVTVQNCNLDYFGCSKRMLGSILGPDAPTIEQEFNGDTSNCSVINCEFKNSDSHAILTKGDSNLIRDCYFYNIDFSVSELPFLMQTIYMRGYNSVFRNNTVYMVGASATLDQGFYPICENNNISQTGFLQSDGAISQLTAQQQPDSEIKYNWFHDTIKRGARFDAPVPPTIWGSNGIMHHNVGIRCFFGLEIKGEYHFCYNNMGMDCEQQDICIVNDSGEGGGANVGTITRNNAANRISGSRTAGVYQAIPGTDDHNWNGYVTEQDIRTQLRDPDNYDFRPKAASDLVDAGVVVSGITDGYLGSAPDIGAYEYGDTNYWIAGRRFDKASTPIPPDGATYVKTDADLMWLEGLDANSSDVYFGTVSGSLTYQTNQSNNIYNPGTLSTFTTYYWRIDTVTASDTITGDEWSFDTNVPVETTCTADTFTYQASPDTNFGTQNYVTVNGTGSYERLGYYKFTVANTNANVTAAKLKLRSYSAQPPSNASVHKVTGTWTETGLTWNNDSLTWVSQLDSIGTAAVNTWYSFDVASFVTGDGTYTFGVKKPVPWGQFYSKEGGSIPRLIVTRGTDTTPPAAPTGITTIAGDSLVIIDWSDNTEYDLDGYNIYRSTTSGTGFTKINSSLLSASTYSDNTVVNDTTYYYKVTAVDISANESDYSNEDFAVPTYASSGTEYFNPTDDTFINQGLPDNNYGTSGWMTVQTTVRYSYLQFSVTGVWGTVSTATLNVRSKATGFDDCYAFEVTGTWDESTLTWNNSSLTHGDDIDSNAPIAAETWYAFDVTSWITGNGTYSIGLRSSNTDTTSQWYPKENTYVPELEVVWASDTTPPTAPTGLAATPADSQVSLDWNDNTETDLDGYNVYRSTTSGSGFSKINGSLVTPSDYTDTTVSNDTTYYYKVTAVDDGSNESGYSSEVSAYPQDTTPPANPTGLGATPGDGEVSLDWNDNTESDFDGYNVYRSTTTGSGYSKINGALVSVSDYTDTTVSNGTTYYYVTTAVDNSSNESGYSNEVSALPEAPASDIYVYDITMAGYEGKTNYHYATATVWIKDESLNNINGATVYGSWSGATKKGDEEQTTGEDGKATLTSDTVKGGGTFTFTVTNVTATGYTYNSSLNNEDYDSITVP